MSATQARGKSSREHIIRKPSASPVRIESLSERISINWLTVELTDVAVLYGHYIREVKVAGYEDP
jgi:hypothetical protein